MDKTLLDRETMQRHDTGQEDGDLSPDIFFHDDDDIDSLEDHYVQLPKKGKAQHNMRVFEYGAWVSRLFLGITDEPPATHAEVTKFLAQSPDELGECNKRRDEYKREFLAGAASKDLWLPYSVWKVRHDVALPFLLLVDMPWFNSRSVAPDQATLDEMQQSGRIVHANQIFYDNYAKTLQHLLAIEPYTRPHNDSIDLFAEWHTPESFTWYKPMHTTVIAYCGNVLQWSMFLAIRREDIDRNLDRIVVPQNIMVAAFAGEIKVLDLYQPEPYAFTYIHRRKKGSTYLVCTMHSTPTRPGIASLAFFSNHTCLKQPWFAAKHHSFYKTKPRYLAKKQKNVVLGSPEIYRHRTLSTTLDITGRMFRNIHNHIWTQPPFSFENPEDALYYYCPVEWNYYATHQHDTSSSNKCHCLSHCHTLAEKSHGLVVEAELSSPRQSRDPKVKPDYYANLYLSQFS